MKNFRVQIRAYGYFADFKISAEDGPISIENAIIDKLGKNDIIWDQVDNSKEVSHNDT